MLFSLNSSLIFDFNQQSDMGTWSILDDVVMGGRSDGSMALNDEGHAVYEGSVSTENNGGFSSVRHRLDKFLTEPNSVVKVRLKGDGKDYQLRVKHKSSDYYSYIKSFSTTGDWQEISIPLKEMYPSFRGRRLNYPNFDKEYIEEIVFLIGNKKNEDFKLVLDYITLN